MTETNANNKESGTAKKQYGYNPAHIIATCGDCGAEMVYNVPRMGPGGGFVHKATGKLQCEQPNRSELSHPRLMTPENPKKPKKKKKKTTPPARAAWCCSGLGG